MAEVVWVEGAKEEAWAAACSQMVIGCVREMTHDCIDLT
jgi:hypothetical protein